MADELIQSASHWLFTRRIPIPGARRLQDWARDAFAAVEAQILDQAEPVRTRETIYNIIDGVQFPDMLLVRPRR